MLGRQDFDLLSSLGVSDPNEFSTLDAKAVNAIITKWRSESGNSGVLVHRLRAAIKSQSAKRAATMLEREAEYGRSIVAFIAKRYPDLCERGMAHPAAIATVIRLRFVHGQASLRAADYDAPIRAAVERWEAQNA